MVDRCICMNVTFAELKRVREEGGLSLDQLMQKTGCCKGCTMCEPYVRLVIRTGRTSFDVLSPLDLADAMKDQKN